MYHESRTMIPCRHARLTLSLSGRLTKGRAVRRAAFACKAGGDPVAGTVVLKKGKANLFRAGQPIVFSTAVDRVEGRPAPGPGDLVALADANRAPLGWGAFNPHSYLRVRVLQWVGEEGGLSGEGVLAGLLEQRVTRAAALRAALGLPSAQTTVYRLLNSEGDGVSGLTVDALGPCLVVSSSAAWVERRRTLLEALLLRATGAAALQWRPMAGFLREEGLEVAEPVPDPEASDLEVVEEGVRFYAAPYGQKTGFYADQRESRALVRRLAAGRAVLDLCCYSGGFALSAALGGAADITGVDSSGPAIALAERNRALNGLSPATCRFVKADVLAFLGAGRSRSGGPAALAAAPAASSAVRKGAPDAAPAADAAAGAAEARDAADVPAAAAPSAPAAAGKAAPATSPAAEPPGAETPASVPSGDGLLGRDGGGLGGGQAACEDRGEAEGGQGLGGDASGSRRRQWDLVILDPPKLAPKRSGVKRALNAYRKMNTAALRAVAPGGLFMTCSCSGVVAQDGALLPTVREAAAAAGRRLTLLRTAGAAPDHPLDPGYPEGEYLTNLLFRVH